MGHRTGGLGKVPGYYFQEHLDNTIVLASGLEKSMHAAMRASWEEVQVLAEEAARKEFPPEEQVQRYNAVRIIIHMYNIIQTTMGGHMGGLACVLDFLWGSIALHMVH